MSLVRFSILSVLLKRPAVDSLQYLRAYKDLRSMSSAVAKRLEGKTILVTGASSGIGKSTAQEFARTAPKNLKLILTARRVDTLKEIAAEIQKEVGDGVKVLPVQLDISKAGEVRDLIKSLPEEYRQVDVLVNNAGLVKGVAKVGEIAEEDTAVMFDTNVTGLINMTQAVLPAMKERGSGDIINVGSIAGRDPYPGGAIYCATKAAVRSFTNSLRKELISSRVRVMEIDPGQVETEFSVVRFYGDKSKADAVYAGCEPLTPEDIAEVIVFAAGRRENVVVADTLVFPNHQVSANQDAAVKADGYRLAQASFIRNRNSVQHIDHQVVKLVVPAIDFVNQVCRFVTSRTTLPLPSISYTEYRPCHADGAACCDICCSTPVEAGLKHVDAVLSVILYRACIQLIKVHAMLECTIFYKLLLSDILVTFRQAHGKA